MRPGVLQLPSRTNTSTKGDQMSLPNPPQWMIDAAHYRSPSEQRAEPPDPPILSPPKPNSPLPTQSEIRKTIPLASGCFDYFTSALAEVARLSWAGNQKHNTGEPLHDARSKSTDDADCLLRHFADRGKMDTIAWLDEEGVEKTMQVRHSAAVAWRALRILQKELEADGAPLAPGARL